MITKQQWEDLNKASRQRRQLHPDWPSHKPTLREPNGKVTVFENMPVAKIEHCRGYCKYCYTTHGDWWRMDEREVMDGEPIVLCGRCEHMSLAGLAGIGRKHW